MDHKREVDLVGSAVVAMRAGKTLFKWEAIQS